MSPCSTRVSALARPLLMRTSPLRMMRYTWVLGTPFKWRIRKLSSRWPAESSSTSTKRTAGGLVAGAPSSGGLPPIMCFTCALFCKWLICLEFSPLSLATCAGRSMPAGVAHADCGPDARNGLGGSRRADKLKHRYGIPQTGRCSLPGTGLPADQSEHVVVDGLDGDFMAAALAPRHAHPIAASALPASANSYQKHSKSAPIPLAPIHAPLPPVLSSPSAA
jgi:hypothetical protein